MKKLPLKSLLKRIYQISVFYFTLLFYSTSRADLPPAPNNSNISSGDYLAGIGDFAKEAIKYTILVVTAAVIIGYMWALIAKFLDAKKHHEWGEFGLVAIVGAGVVMIAIVLANVAMKYFGGSN